MQLVGRHKYKCIPDTMAHFRSELLLKLCLTTHPGMGMVVLCWWTLIWCIATYHGEGVCHFTFFLCVGTVYLSFSASGIKLCMPGCPAAWLCLLLFFTRRKQPCTFLTIHSNPCANAMFKAGSQQLLDVQIANTGISTVDGDTKQLFWASGPPTMQYMCCYACA